MAEELASDCGFMPKTDEYKSFVNCINNILEYGCTYSRNTMDKIREKCEVSRLPVARAILRECDRAMDNDSRIRPSNLKWWQTYRKPDRRLSNERRRSSNGRASPLFTKYKTPNRQKRPMSPLFQRESRKRPMSPLFEPKPAVPNWSSRKRRRR